MQRHTTTVGSEVNTLFQKNLPTYPYATNDFQEGLHRHRKVDAPKFKYIQHNPSNSMQSMVVDIDHDVYPDDIEPRPNIIVSNKDNAKAHAIYLIKPNVHLNEHSSRKPIIFAENVLKGLTHRLEGDPNYAGLICKNPLNDSYRVYNPRNGLYDLTELAEWIPDKILKAKPLKEDPAYGRNCQVFDWCRHWAYIAIREFVSGSFEAWHTEVLTRCIGLNLNVYLPMTQHEVKTIAKSISKWVWSNRFKLTDYSKQRARANRLAVKRKIILIDNQTKANEMLEMGYKTYEIADTLGVQQRTVQRWLRGMSI